jgi:hypothetical protein
MIRATESGSSGRAALTGAIGFGAASLAVFATVAFAERWMYRTLGLTGAYLTWTLLFILLGGAALAPLARPAMKIGRFYLLFAAAFFLYAVGWVGAYFTLRGRAGEWVGAIAGSILMALAISAGFKNMKPLSMIAAILFIANAAGYFLGSALNDAVSGPAGMLLWGAAYGVGLGAGLGASIGIARTTANNSFVAE